MNYEVNVELGDAYNTSFVSAELSKKEATWTCLKLLKARKVRT